MFDLQENVSPNVSPNVSVIQLQIRDDEDDGDVCGFLGSRPVGQLGNHDVLGENHGAVIIRVRDGEIRHHVALCTLLDERDIRGILLKCNSQLGSLVRVQDVSAVSLYTLLQRDIILVTARVNILSPNIRSCRLLNVMFTFMGS